MQYDDAIILIAIEGFRLKWAGHVERMEEDRLTKIADAYREEGRRRRGRPRLRWEDCVKRYAGIEGNWKGEAHGRREWRQLVRTVIHPRTPEQMDARGGG